MMRGTGPADASNSAQGASGGGMFQVLREVARLDRLLKEEQEARVTAVRSLEDQLATAQQETRDVVQRVTALEKQQRQHEANIKLIVADVLEAFMADKEPTGMDASNMQAVAKAEASNPIMPSLQISMVQEHSPSTAASEEEASLPGGWAKEVAEEEEEEGLGSSKKIVGIQFRGFDLKLPVSSQPTPRGTTPRPASTNPLDAVPTPRMTPRITRSASGTDLQTKGALTVGGKAWDDFERGLQEEIARIGARLNRSDA